MKNLAQHICSLAITAWVGALWAIGYIAVYILFRAQPDKQLAGLLSGQMLAVVSYIGIVCGTYLLLYRLSISGKAALREWVFWLVAAMLAITLLLQFGIYPLMADIKLHAQSPDVMQSALAPQFKMWHGISSILYLAESLLGAVLVIKGASKKL
ncbi:MAG: hypothetical protein A3H31_07960 [Gallionellales bacterium RIFCSPLOWO2_02_FULL_57_47]|nr:MAG: hypothetical protein A3H31_07960 [Gallionellales bacterium RIFCSPLOWO2_02_FULL_57_47]OGT15956.1 MAG: hypothetical protein A3J49_07635 [Gallionellales bacterium RIFCSPHIGHO2_02_FULL_57_16]